MRTQTLFSEHHRLLDRLYEDLERHAGTADWSGARRAFAAFRDAIERHMRAEEEVLFPAYESVHGADNALTGILRKGHRDLRSFFAEIEESLASADKDETQALLGTTRQIIAHHDAREETEFYPAVDPLLPEGMLEKAASQLTAPA